MKFLHQHFHIFPDIALFVRISQQISWVICGQQPGAIVLMESPPESGDGRRGFKQRLGRKRAEGADEVRLDSRKLALQEGQAGLDLIGFWVPVARRAALDDIADVNLVAAQFDGFDNACEQLPGGSDKRPSLPVFLKARAFADKDQLGLGIALSEYDPFALPGQSTALAITQIGCNLRQRFGLLKRGATPLFDSRQRLLRAIEATPSKVG